VSRKLAERQARQRFVVDAARQLCTTQGIENTRMQDIASAVDYTRRTLYAYFKSRDDILLLMVAEDLRTRWAEQKAALAKADTGLEKFLVWGRTLYAYSKKNPCSIRLQYYWDYRGMDEERVSPEAFANFKDINEQLAEGLREIFNLGIADGTMRPELDVDTTISQFLYSFRAVLNRALTDTYSFASPDTDAYTHSYLDLFTRAIRNVEGNTE
jgi:AcrR family transcriptional regulator